MLGAEEVLRGAGEFVECAVMIWMNRYWHGA